MEFSTVDGTPLHLQWVFPSQMETHPHLRWRDMDGAGDPSAVEIGVWFRNCQTSSPAVFTKRGSVANFLDETRTGCFLRHPHRPVGRFWLQSHHPCRTTEPSAVVLSSTASYKFCHHILLRECHVRDVDDMPSTLWFYVGNEVIRFSAVELCLVTGLTFGDSSESPSNISKHMDKRLHQSYFKDGKVHVKVFANWFRNLGPNNNVSDDDMVKLALILFLEMTLVGKDDRNVIQYWALQLVDDLDAFNNFPWGTFIYGRTFDSISTCLVGRDDKYKERLESPTKRKAKKYNVYGFVWAIEAIPKWAMLGHASRVNNVSPRILNWKCTGTPSYVELFDNIFKYKNLTIAKFLVPTDEEVMKPYWAGINYKDDFQEDIDNVERDVEKKYDDGKDDIQHSDVGYDMKRGVKPTSVIKDQVGSKKG
ncbi:hypothetical protein Dsin_013025 [Dipteronia sinensis]|uniref:DUF1985 domain-containing protein n=1 Tax=Dipteronia sinensis TaxID=43782 RepID=A0AAE0EA69_9ROSI|nr:hypothetical protein Dsin_013025 [Dipteronia sinensis]